MGMMRSDWAVEMPPLGHGWIDTYERWLGRRGSRQQYRHLLALRDPAPQDAMGRPLYTILQVRVRWDMGRIHRADVRVWSNAAFGWTRVCSEPARSPRPTLLGADVGRAMCGTRGTEDQDELWGAADVLYNGFVMERENHLLQNAARVLFGRDSELPAITVEARP
jgi:hypothetical protein